MKVLITEKLESGELTELDQREWSREMLVALESANYLLVHGKEYEMIEGRLNVDLGVMEILVIAVKQE